MSQVWRLFLLLWFLSMLPSSAVAGDKIPGDVPCAGQIAYQSDKDDAYKYLENLQRQIYAQNPQLADPYSRAEMNQPQSVATMADLRARALKTCPDPSSGLRCAFSPETADGIIKKFACLSLPTRFESPLFVTLIDLYTTELDKVRTSHFPQSSITQFGSLPTGTFDAQAIFPPGSGVPLVILNRDIFFFTGALSKAIVDSIPIVREGQSVHLKYSEQAIRARLREQTYIVHNFADAMSRLVTEGSSTGATEVLLDNDHNQLHARLLASMDRFLISHEQAHVILGHISDRSVEFRLAGSYGKETSLKLTGSKPGTLLPTPKTPIDKNLTPLKRELRTREQEFEADALGFKLMIWGEEVQGNRFSETVSGAAPQMIFRVLDAANAYGSEAGGWTFSDANHPTAADRIKALSTVFDEVAKTSEPLRESDFRIPFDVAFRVLLEEADPQIRQNLRLKTKETK